jgi:hypothetical protein
MLFYIRFNSKKESENEQWIVQTELLEYFCKSISITVPIHTTYYKSHWVLSGNANNISFNNWDCEIS